jgi:hypothetical protein
MRVNFYPEEMDLRTLEDETLPQCGFKLGPCSGCGKCEPRVEE